MTATIVSRNKVLSGWVNVDRLQVQMPDGAVVERHVEDHGDGVAVLPYDPERRVVLLISQPRPAVLLDGSEDILELIAGRLDGIAAADRAREEAIEEAGVRLSVLEQVVHLWSMPSISTERLHIFLSVYSEKDRVSTGGGLDGEHENITVHELAISFVSSEAAAGRIEDAKTLVAFQALQIRYPDLFN